MDRILDLLGDTSNTSEPPPPEFMKTFFADLASTTPAPRPTQSQPGQPHAHPNPNPPQSQPHLLPQAHPPHPHAHQPGAQQPIASQAHLTSQPIAPKAAPTKITLPPGTTTLPGMTREKFNALSSEQQQRIIELTSKHRAAAAVAAAAGKATPARPGYPATANVPAGSAVPIAPGIANQNFTVKASPSATTAATATPTAASQQASASRAMPATAGLAATQQALAAKIPPALVSSRGGAPLSTMASMQPDQLYQHAQLQEQAEKARQVRQPAPQTAQSQQQAQQQALRAQQAQQQALQRPPGQQGKVPVPQQGQQRPPLDPTKVKAVPQAAASQQPHPQAPSTTAPSPVRAKQAKIQPAPAPSADSGAPPAKKPRIAANKDEDEEAPMNANEGDGIQDIDALTDVTRLAGVNLKDEEGYIIPGQEDQAQADLYLEQDKEPDFVDLKAVKLLVQRILSKQGMHCDNEETYLFISHCAEEWMREILENLVKLSKYRRGQLHFLPQDRLVITSDVGKKLRQMELQEREKLEREEREKQKTTVEGVKKDQKSAAAREQVQKQKQEEEERQRTSAANIAALSAIGDIRLPGARPKPTAPPPKTQITVNGSPALVAKGVPPKAPASNLPAGTTVASTTSKMPLNSLPLSDIRRRIYGKQTVSLRDLTSFLERNPMYRHSTIFHRTLSLHSSQPIVTPKPQTTSTT